MSKFLYIAEYRGFGQSPNGGAVDVAPSEMLALQKVDFTAAHAESNQLNDKTQMIELISDTAGNFVIGASPTATTANQLLPANVYKRISVPLKSGLKVSIV